MIPKKFNFDLISALTKKELKVRYKHHAFGYLWSISNPLAYTVIYFLVFKLVMKVKVDNFPLFLISGLFPWQWIANSIGVGPSTFLNNSSLIKKVRFPRNLLSFVVVLQDMIHFVISIPLIIIALYIYELSPSLSWIAGIPILCTLQLILTYSLNLFTATINLFFRDMEKLIQMLLTFLFFLTPVVYRPEMIPDELKNFLYLNPIASIIICWRELFMESSINTPHLAIACGWTAVMYVLSRFTFNKLSWRFAEVL